MSADTASINLREQERIYQRLYERMPGFTPGWTPAEGSAAAALLRIFARYMAYISYGLNLAPERGLLAFLDTLGIMPLPAQAARAPLVFTLIDDCPVDMPLPAGLQVAAQPQPAAPSLLSAGETPALSEQAIFTATQAITLARARLAALYSVDPDADSTADHTARLASGFTLFDAMQLNEHALYLGHDQLFKLPESASIRLSFEIPARKSGQIRTDLKLAWEYLSAEGWRPLRGQATERWLEDGVVQLEKRGGPAAKQESLFGRASYWIRARLLTPLAPGGIDDLGTLPQIGSIRAAVSFSKDSLPLDAACTDTVPVDLSNAFYPFGQQPALGKTFYIASREVFAQQGAPVRIDVTLSHAGTAHTQDPKKPLTLTWEYFNGNEWSTLDGYSDGTDRFTSSSKQSTITFSCPGNWATTEVNGEPNYWLRARIDQGDYGGPQSWANGAPVAGTAPDPPVVKAIRLGYSLFAEGKPLDHCLACNGSLVDDHSPTARWPRRLFTPFLPVADRSPAVYFGFDRALPSGLVSLYVHLPDAAEDETDDTGSDFSWEYNSPRGWAELAVRDETSGFRHSGLIQFIGQWDAAPSPGIGGALYRVRARLKQDSSLRRLPVAGLWMNAVWGEERHHYEREPIGTADGGMAQALRFPQQRLPILEGESILVREWSGRGGELALVVPDASRDDMLAETNPATGDLTTVWVRWQARPHLYASDPSDRHYTLDRGSGLLRFGDGRRGRIPPAGASIVASYDSGGGVAGNLPIGAISELRSAVPFVKTVLNPVPARGGASPETQAMRRARGPQQLRHGGRGVAASDIAWLAREAAPTIARARCLPLTGPAGRGQRGWISLVIVPHSRESQPRPDQELQRRVYAYLARRVPAAVAGHIRIVDPQYVPVSVATQIVPLRADDASLVEARVRERLNAFLHPLSGGADGLGWAFGEPVFLSQIAALIEATPGVDYACRIGLHVNGRLYGDVIEIDADTLIAAGDYEIRLSLGEG